MCMMKLSIIFYFISFKLQVKTVKSISGKIVVLTEVEVCAKEILSAQTWEMEASPAIIALNLLGVRGFVSSELGALLKDLF